jgi:fructose-1,6-bisphosphatase/inositol monophosphatase family enzyme
MSTNEKYLKVAMKAAKDSGKIFKQYFGKPKNVSIKNGDPRNLVTEIDVKIEKRIRQAIAKHFSQDKIIGEEMGTGKNISKQDKVWIIDPIDGTTNFIRGIPLVCISIGVWDGQGPLMGVVYNPIINQMYTAVRGKGAFLNGKQISVSKVPNLAAATGGIGWLSPENGKKIFNSTIAATRKLRILATSAWQTCMVASGHLDYYATRDVHIWDVAGPIAILKEAGGISTDFKNKSLKLDLLEIVASNKKLHAELIKKIYST